MSGITTKLDILNNEVVISEDNDIQVNIVSSPIIENFIGSPGPAGRDGIGSSLAGLVPYVNAKDPSFAGGAKGDGVTDDTAALQAFINYLSNNFDVVGFIPPGLYKYTKLYLFYDISLNPGFNSANSKRGRLTILGGGALDEARATAYDLTNGTILESIITDGGSSFNIASESLGHNASPFSSRDVTFKDITFAANNPGYVIDAAGAPELWFSNVVITQKNSAGHGVNIRSPWFGWLERVKILFSGTINTSTGTGLTLGTEAFAGQFNIDGLSVIQDFGTNIEWVGPDKFSNLNLSNVSIQSANSVGIKISSPLYSISFSNIHFENNLQDILTTAEIDVFYVSLVRLLAGKTISGESLPRFDLQGGIKTGEIKNIDCFRPWSNFIEISGSTSSRCNLDVSHIAFIHDTSASLTKNITNCTNSAGLVKVTISAHGYTSGRKIKIASVLGTTEANGEWYITVIDSDSFTLDGSDFVNAYTSGGQSTLICHVVKPLNTYIVPSISDITFTGGSSDLDNTGAFRVIDTSINSSYFYRSVNGFISPYLSAPFVEYNAAGNDIQIRTEIKHFLCNTTALTNIMVIIPEDNSTGRFSGTFCFLTNSQLSTNRLRIRQNHDSVIVGFLAPGESAIIFHDKITHVVRVQKLMQSFKSISYGDSDPSYSGTLGDIHFMSNPVSGGYVGRVMTGTGWKQFGQIT